MILVKVYSVRNAYHAIPGQEMADPVHRFHVKLLYLDGVEFSGRFSVFI